MLAEIVVAREAAVIFGFAVWQRIDLGVISVAGTLSRPSRKDGRCHMSSLQPKHRWSLAIGGILLSLLLAAVFTFGSLDVPFEPGSWRARISLFAVSSF